MYKFKNLAKGTLSAQLLIGGSSLVLQSGEGAIFPDTGATNLFRGIIWGSAFNTPFDDSSYEVVEAYRSAGDTFTIVRSQEGTSAKQWESGDNFMLTVTAEQYEELVVGPASAVDGNLASFDTTTGKLIKDSGMGLDGWIASGETWTYSSVDDPTGIITVPSDATTKYSVGMRISFVNATNTIYGIITAVTSTTITFLHEIDPTDSLALHLMANSAITVPKYSTQKAPIGFPLSPAKWTIEINDTTQRSQASPTTNTWYNLGSLSIDIPIGLWSVSYNCLLGIQNLTNVAAAGESTLSTANNTESDPDFSASFKIQQDATSSFTNINGMVTREKVLDLATKDTYYWNARNTISNGSFIRFENSIVPGIIRAVCAYL